MAEIRKKEEKVQEVEKPKFRPGAKYEWEPTDEFVFSGNEFSVIYNKLYQSVNTEAFQKQLLEAQRTMATYEAFLVLQAAFEKGVEEGLIREVYEMQEPSPEDIND